MYRGHCKDNGKEHGQYYLGFRVEGAGARASSVLGLTVAVLLGIQPILVTGGVLQFGAAFRKAFCTSTKILIIGIPKSYS